MKVNIQYFAKLKDDAKKADEIIDWEKGSVGDLYQSLQKKYNFKMDQSQLRVAVNNEFVSWDSVLQENDDIIFVPPVSGG